MMRSSLQVVAEAVYTLLQSDAELVAAATGIYDVVPENPAYPFVWIEVSRPIDARGFGLGSLPQLDVRVHTYSLAPQMVEAQVINDRVVRTLADVPLPIDDAATSWRPAGWILSESEIVLGDEVLRGVAVHEVVSMFRLYVEDVTSTPS